MLFAALSPEYDGVELASVPALQYWNVFLSRLLAEASGTADAAKWNKVAKGIQFLAIKPMTACIERHVDSKFCDSIAARALLQHLKALTGPAENSSMKALKKTDYRRLPFLANDTDVRHIPTTVLDFDRTAASRELAHSLEATGRCDVIGAVHDPAELDDAQ